MWQEKFMQFGKGIPATAESQLCALGQRRAPHYRTANGADSFGAVMTFTLLGNPLQHWGAALAVALGATAAMYGARALALRRVSRLAPRPHTRIDHVLADMLASTYLLFIVAIAVYLGSLWLNLPGSRQLLISRVAVSALLLQLAVWGDTGLRAWRDLFRAAQAAGDGNGSRRASTTVLCFIARLALWLIMFLMLLDNLGFNITTLVASLGIGGVAVALATQNILGDLFASLSIMLDKPFEIGDFIIVGDVLGWVEHVGLKTTRVRGLGGEQVVFSNGELLRSRIHNHKRLQSRRVAFVVRAAYGTGEQLLSRIPEMVREIVTAHPDDEIAFEHCHFMRYGDWSLDFEVVYHYRSPDYFRHLDAQQAIFLELYRRFEREGIQFAHPLSVVRLADSEDAARLAQQLRTPPGPAMRH
jgi:small-conductance mechanosensitive channel